MPTSAQTSAGAIVAVIALSVLALLLWIVQLAALADLADSDAAGNALSQAYTAIAIIILWVLLAIVTIIAAVKGALPLPAVIAALVLVPASGFAAMVALNLLSHPDLAPYLWPIVTPALAPPLIIAFCFWALVPALRTAVSARVAAGSVWSAVLVLCVFMVPMVHVRSLVVEQVADARAKYAADFASMPPDSPLWDWVPFLATPDDTRVEAVLDRIRHLDHRQSDAEIMLDRGDFPLGYLHRFDLDPTPALCDKTRALLRRRVAPLVLQPPDSRPYADIGVAVADAVAAMSWLVGYDCACEAESSAWEDMTKAYRDTGFDVVRLRELRDPKELGRVLREYPDRFSMLTPKAHLKAWLKFAADTADHDQALAGARALDHRTADAVEMLRGSEHDARTVMAYLPDLALDATPALCAAALWNLHGQFEKIYRPRDDDPRQYRELLGRLGSGDQFPALQWLAEHGCDAEAQLSEAEAMVLAYQDSPDRAQTLATLARLHRKR